jgi:hypothetical protein
LRDHNSIGSVFIQSALNAFFITVGLLSVHLSKAFSKKFWNSFRAFSISGGNLREEKQSFRTVHWKVYRNISFISSQEIFHISNNCFFQLKSYLNGCHILSLQ